MSNKQEHLFKILVIGATATGKSSLIKRYIGVDFALKVVQHDENTVIRLQLWDIAGQSKVNNLLRVYYKDAVGAFVVYDVTNFGSLEAALQLKKNLDSKVTLPNGTPIPCVLLANKVDLDKDETLANQTYIDQLSEEHGFSKQFDTSAKENIGIKEATSYLIDKVLEAVVADGPGPAPDKDIIQLDKNHINGDPNKKKSKCCSG